MKLSPTTFAILKNFSSINQSILFKQGNQLRSISVMRNILAEATVEEEFPRDFGIYDLNEFLNGLDYLYNEPELIFKNDSYVLIKEGNSCSKYFFADPNVIVSPPEKSISLPSEDVCFLLNTKDLDKLLKSASVYQLPDLSVVGDSESIRLVICDKKDSTSNEFAIEVGKTVNEFVFNFKIENLRLIKGSYEVVMSYGNQPLARFQNTDIKVKYHVAAEPDSTFS